MRRSVMNYPAGPVPNGGTASASDPFVEFWLEYARSEGALSEDQGDKVLVVLPEALRSDLDLPEEVVVTSDPEVSREDGALLLIPGHPVLDRAAARVLEAADVGRVRLAWPASVPPSAEAMLHAARERVGVAHGRVDMAPAPPVSVWLPVLRVGALVSYAVSVEERFQEREEVWVDGLTGLPLPAQEVERLAAAPLAGKTDWRRVLDVDGARALGGAHRIFEERTAARLAVLSRQTEALCGQELERATAYYEGVLASVAKRREAAVEEERRTLLAAQAAATELERARRLQEIEEKYRPAHEVRPFRMLQYLVPALSLPVQVRRGERIFPFELLWMLPFASFAPVACPGCGAGIGSAGLVAGRDRLGCPSCLPPPTRSTGSVRSVGSAPRAVLAPAPGSQPAPGSRLPGSLESSPAPATRSPSSPSARGAPGGGPDSKEPRASVPAAAKRRRADRLARKDPSTFPPNAAFPIKTGRRVAMAFWQRAIQGRRWPARQTAPGSPLDALYRVLGPDAPFVAVGMPDAYDGLDVCAPESFGDPPLVVGTWGLVSPERWSHRAAGFARHDRDEYGYTIRWRLEARTPVVEEILPFLGGTGELFPRGYPRWPAAVHPSDPPAEALDPVAWSLWRAHLVLRGLPFVARCLALWWRMEGSEDLQGYPPSALAAGVCLVVGKRSMAKFARRDAADAHGADPSQAGELARIIGRHLGPSLTRVG